MSHIEKEKLIKADIASIENRVRHAFNQGYDLGYKEGKANCSEIPKGSPKYCDRNICLKNEYNNVGCEDCEVTKSQESSGDNVVSRDVVKKQMIMYGFHAPDMTVTEFVEDLPPANPKEPTTKNNLGVDAISRADARSLICKIDIKHRMLGMSRKVFKDLYDGMDELPSVTPQEPFKPMVEIDLYSVIKQKYIEREVLDKIICDIQRLRGCSCSCSDGIIDDVEDILDKYKADIEPQESEDDE